MAESRPSLWAPGGVYYISAYHILYIYIYNIYTYIYWVGKTSFNSFKEISKGQHHDVYCISSCIHATSQLGTPVSWKFPHKFPRQKVIYSTSIVPQSIGPSKILIDLFQTSLPYRIVMDFHGPNGFWIFWKSTHQSSSPRFFSIFRLYSNGTQGACMSVHIITSLPKTT